MPCGTQGNGDGKSMESQLNQIVTKTPQGVNATRVGDGLLPKSHAVLKLFDSAKPVSELKKICAGAGISAAEFAVALKELKKLDYLREVDPAAEANAVAEAEAERRMLLTLDFTAVTSAPGAKAQLAKRVPVAPMVPAAPVAPAKVLATPALALPMSPVSRMSPKAAVSAGPAVQGAAVVTAPTPTQSASATQAATEPSAEDRAREAKAARLKLEAEVRQKLSVALRPKIEEELRAKLRTALEEELRPKLIAALRPGVEAELRSSVTQELTPRIELELKARFAKSLAAQKAAERAEMAPPAAPAPALSSPAAVANSAFERVLASLNMPVFSTDTNGVCTYCSPAWAQFSGSTASDTVGKPLSEFFVAASQRGVSVFLHGIANGTALRFEYQGALARKRGDPLWVEISAAPLYSASGEPVGVCGSLRDAVEWRRVSEQAEADGVRLLLLVDQIDTGVVVEDRDGNIQQTNPALCALLSLDAAPYSLEGMPVTDLLELASKGFIGPEGFLRRVAEIRAAGEDAKGETFVMADGRVIQHDYLAVTVGDHAAGYVWLFKATARAQMRPAP